jgi:hypothetical protein
MIIEYFLLFQYESIKKYQVLCNGAYERLERYESKKNKTRKIKKNYL